MWWMSGESMRKKEMIGGVSNKLTKEWILKINLVAICDID